MQDQVITIMTSPEMTTLLIAVIGLIIIGLLKGRINLFIARTQGALFFRNSDFCEGQLIEHPTAVGSARAKIVSVTRTGLLLDYGENAGEQKMKPVPMEKVIELSTQWAIIYKRKPTDE